MKRRKYASDISREKFGEIEALLRSVRKATKPTKVDPVRSVLRGAVPAAHGLSVEVLA